MCQDFSPYVVNVKIVVNTSLITGSNLPDNTIYDYYVFSNNYWFDFKWAFCLNIFISSEEGFHNIYASFFPWGEENYHSENIS